MRRFTVTVAALAAAVATRDARAQGARDQAALDGRLEAARFALAFGVVALHAAPVLPAAAWQGGAAAWAPGVVAFVGVGAAGVVLGAVELAAGLRARRAARERAWLFPVPVVGAGVASLVFVGRF